jgi:hypothetical protein
MTATVVVADAPQIPFRAAALVLRVGLSNDWRLLIFVLLVLLLVLVVVVIIGIAGRKSEDVRESDSILRGDRLSAGRDQIIFHLLADVYGSKLRNGRGCSLSGQRCRSSPTFGESQQETFSGRVWAIEARGSLA